MRQRPKTPGPIKSMGARVWGMVGKAILRTLSNEAVPRATVEYSPKALSSGVEFVGWWGFASRPLIGAEVLYVAKNGTPDHMCVVGVIDRRNFPNDLADGDGTMYNQHGDRIRLNANRSAEVNVNGALIKADATEIRLELGASSIVLTPAGITITGTTIDLN